MRQEQSHAGALLQVNDRMVMYDILRWDVFWTQSCATYPSVVFSVPLWGATWVEVSFDCDTHVHPMATPRSILNLLCPPLVTPPIAGAPRRGSCPIGVGGRGLGSACNGLRHVAVFQVLGARRCVVSEEKSEEDRS